MAVDPDSGIGGRTGVRAGPVNCGDGVGARDWTSTTQDVVGLLAGKWLVAVLCELHEAPKRNFQLRHAIHGISAKMLSDTLRRLTRDGFVTHVVHDDAQGQIGLGYALTGLGRSAFDLLQVVHDWGSEYLDEVDANRAQCEGHLEVP